MVFKLFYYTSKAAIVTKVELAGWTDMNASRCHEIKDLFIIILLNFSLNKKVC